MPIFNVRVFGVVLLGGFFLSACNCGPGTIVTGGRDGGGAGASSGTGGGGNTGGTAGSSSGMGGGAGAGAGTGGSNGLPETCDGVDNDMNGIVDDVDVAGDGVCDCLRIATLGIKGTHGGGDVFSNWLNGKSNNGAVSLGAQQITAALLAPFQVVIIQDAQRSAIGRDYTPSEVTALREWVNNGGGVMTLIGYGAPSEVENVNRLLQPFGLSYGTMPILPKSGSMTVPITRWERHPVSEGVMRVGVDNGYPVLGGTLIASEPTPGQWDMARGVELGRGHVLVWGDEWISYNSEWGTQTGYQVERFWLNSLKWLTAQNQCQVPITIN